MYKKLSKSRLYDLIRAKRDIKMRFWRNVKKTNMKEKKNRFGSNLVRHFYKWEFNNTIKTHEKNVNFLEKL